MLSQGIMTLVCGEKTLTSPLFSSSSCNEYSTKNKLVFTAIEDYVNKREKERYCDESGEEINATKNFIRKPILRRTQMSEVLDLHDLKYCNSLLSEGGIQLLLEILHFSEKLECTWLQNLLVVKCAEIVMTKTPTEIEQLFSKESTDTTEALTSRKLSWLLPLIHDNNEGV